MHSDCIYFFKIWKIINFSIIPKLTFQKKKKCKQIPMYFPRSFPVHIQINSKFLYICVCACNFMWSWYKSYLFIYCDFFTKYITNKIIYMSMYFLVLLFCISMYNYSFFHLTAVWVFCFTMSIIHPAMSILDKLCILRQNS